MPPLPGQALSLPSRLRRHAGPFFAAGPSPFPQKGTHAGCRGFSPAARMLPTAVPALRRKAAAFPHRPPPRGTRGHFSGIAPRPGTASIFPRKTEGRHAPAKFPAARNLPQALPAGTASGLTAGMAPCGHEAPRGGRRASRSLMPENYTAG